MAIDALERQVDDLLARYGGGEVDLGSLLCDAHVGGDRPAVVLEAGDASRELGYGELAERSSRLAGALREQGTRPGDRIAVMLPKSPELVVALVAIWRLGAVHVPLFTAFGPDAVSFRVEHSGARLAIADAANAAKVPAGCPVVCVGGGRGNPADLDLDELVASGPAFRGEARSGEDLLILLYTSGTTGNPKGVELPVRALASIHAYMRFSLDLRPDDVYWNMADPGWGYGLWFAILGPLLLGQTTILAGGSFSAERVFETITARGVTNLTGAPTIYRSLRAAGVPEGFRERSRLRAVSSAGEPLNPELLDWSRRELGAVIHDHYGQSELGMPIGFPHLPELASDPVAGSMGVAIPGFAPVVLDDDGEPAAPEEAGALAIDVAASPLYWFRGYYKDPDRTAERFPHGPRHYLTGDSARRGADDRFYFASRADDVITSSGYRIGPFEVESALMAHQAVAEVAVIGVPDSLRGEAVAAVIVTTPGAEPSEELAEELQRFVKERLAKHLYPRQVSFVDALPRTPSGKVRRTVLRERFGDPAATR